MLEGTWSVRYADGTTLSQFEYTAPTFFVSVGHPRGGEVPFRAIDWPRVTELMLESELAKSTFTVTDPGAGYRLALKSRTYMFPNQGMELRAFLVCTERTDLPIDLDRVATVSAATVHVTYWLPDGTTHECPHYDCADVARWVQGCVTGRPTGLMPATHELALTADLLL